MPVTIYLSGHLKPLSGGKTEIALESDFASVGDALAALWEIHPALRDRVLNEQGEIRTHVNIFVGSSDIKRRKGLQTAINAHEIHIFNAVSGG
ncbi:MAG: MoaD/ThiS family protein [Pyrinomonadaceae bacterium]